MKRRVASVGSLFAAALALTACQAQKSSNPLSPSVAGPIPGVAISAPKILDPHSGVKIATDKQPVTLLIENAGSNGPRPLSYDFEVATDANFNNKVFAREAIAPGDGGRTSLRLPDPLGTGRTYFWRARAEDGANTGPYAPAADFSVFTPIIIGEPGPSSPAPNALVDSLRPTLMVADAPRSGPAGAISYLVELGDSDAFANKITWTASEQPNQTPLIPPTDLAYDKVYYWHVRAFDPTTLGPFSATLAFATPSAPPVPPSPPPGGGGPPPNDAIDLRSAQVYNSPADIASWPATAKITSVSMSSSAGLSVEFTTKASWPDVVPPGFAGPLQYTVWAVVNIDGRWYTAGFIQMWRGRPSTGAPILANFATNWAYDPVRWGPMASYQPHAGDQMGFFVSAGNARGEGGVSSIRERSNVVLIPLPAGDNGYFPF
jgi:hypothetical protein